MQRQDTISTRGILTPRSSWHVQLDRCGGIESILSLTRDYLATFGPEHLARLPEDSRPGRVKGEDDIEYWACRLAQARQSSELASPVDGELLQEMLGYFLHAWVRVSEIRRTEPVRAEPQLH
ncbi:MAG: hypothetical protein ACM3X5_09260 [Bacillota bacterium]